MFETLFQYPAVVARHRSGPFAEARERFLNHHASQGLAHTTLQRYARELLVIAERIDIPIARLLACQLLRRLPITGLVSSTNVNVCMAYGGRENSSFKRPRTGFTS